MRIIGRFLDFILSDSGDVVYNSPERGDFLQRNGLSKWTNSNLRYLARESSVSMKPTYSGFNLTSIELFSGFTQITANRLAKITLTYSGFAVTQELWEFYQKGDGTVVEKTITVNHTYSGFDVTKTEVTL